ncbi:MAG TPA: amidoligase family protein [Polyangiaceae bacterium]|nr:amidoligase family protein [Polyangiaceae bacterium]
MSASAARPDVPSSGSAGTGYAAPPRTHNAQGDPRRVGLEVELAGLSVEASLELIRRCFGGELDSSQRTHGTVRGTSFGTFKVEYDLRALQKRSYLRPLELMGIESDSLAAQLVEDTVLQVASEVVPVEVITPPIPWPRLHELDPLWERLRAAGAEDTYDSVFYAFGLHLNPEIPDGQVATLLAYLRAFLLLEDWVVESSHMDLSRRIAPFVRPFPEAYRRKVLAPSYAPNSGLALVDDYLAANPTRNRGLDMLPLFVELFGEAILARVEDRELVKPRPTFHYRLPNCELASPGWSPRADWNRWIAIERLAHTPALLTELSHAYLDTFDLPLRLQSIAWIDELRERITLPGEARSSSGEPPA